jgi:hypothetical protein
MYETMWYVCVPGHVWHPFACMYYVCLDLLCMVVGACYVWIVLDVMVKHEFSLLFEACISFLVMNLTKPLLSRMAPET